MSGKKKIPTNIQLFEQTTHSPALADIVGTDLLPKITDFCFISNPYYPTKKMIRQLQKQLPVLIKSYPSSNHNVWQKRLSGILNVPAENLVLGNGATELITAIVRNLIDELAIPVPTFSEYPDKIPDPKKAKLYPLLPENDYQLNLADYAAWIKKNNISAALIINPGNPTGQLLPLKEIMEFLDELKSDDNQMAHLRMVIVDESFIDFACEDIPTLLPHIQKYPNLMLVRSMSKHCGVSGLRLGYCASANSNLLAELRRTLPAWNINSLSEFFLTQLSETDKEYHCARKKVIEDVRYLYNELCKIGGFRVYETGSNFVLIKSQLGITATELQQILLEKYHAYVRDCSNKTGLDNYHIRVASQGRKKDRVLIEALREISCECWE